MQSHPSVVTMVKGARDGPDHSEAELRPQAHGRLVRLDDGVELHAAEACVAGPVDCEVAESRTDTFPRCSRIDHEAGRGDVGATTRAIRTHLGRTDDAPRLDRDHR